MTTAPKLPEGLEPEGYFTTTDDGRWVEAPEGADRSRLTALYGLAALQAQAAEKDALLAEASKLLKRTPPAAMGMYVGRDRKSFGAQAKDLAAAIDSALLAAKGAK